MSGQATQARLLLRASKKRRVQAAKERERTRGAQADVNLRLAHMSVCCARSGGRAQGKFTLRLTRAARAQLVAASGVNDLFNWILNLVCDVAPGFLRGDPKEASAALRWLADKMAPISGQSALLTSSCSQQARKKKKLSRRQRLFFSLCSASKQARHFAPRARRVCSGAKHDEDHQTALAQSHLRPQRLETLDKFA